MGQSATVGLLRVLLTMNTAEFEVGAKRASEAAKVWAKDLHQIGRQAEQVGLAMTKTLTVPIVAALAGAAKAAIDFESDFANVAKTVDGVADSSGALTKEGKALAQTFRTMAKEIPKTTGELTTIAALGGQMGVPIKQLEHFTKNVAALGVAVDGISTEEAAAGLAQIGNVTGQGTANIDKMASSLVHLGNSSNATEADILEFTKRVAGAGHAVGMTVPEMMAISTAMANVGLNAEAGGTAMSTMIAKMSMAVSQGGESLKAFDRLVADTGQTFADIWTRSPVEAVDAVVQGLARAKARGEDLNLVVRDIGATNIRTADTMKRLAGAGDGIAVSLKTANEGWQTGNKHLEEAEKKYATTANQLKVLWNQVKDVGITFGEALLPAIKSATHLLSGMLPVIDTLAKGFAMLPGPVQMGALGMAGALAAAGPLIFAFGTLARSAGDLVGAFEKKGIAMRGLTKAMETFGGAASSSLSWVTRIGVAARASGLLFAGFTAAVAGIAVPVALVVISDRIDRLRKDLDAIQRASKLAGRAVMDPDEARGIVAAQRAGAAGEPLPGAPKVTAEGAQPGVRQVEVDLSGIESMLPDWFKGLVGLQPRIETRRFQPVTTDEVNVWTAARGAAQAYEGQVVKVTIAQKDAGAQFASTRNLTIEQIQALAQMAGASDKFAAGVIRIGQANTAATGPAHLLALAHKELAEANAAYLKDIDGKRDVLKFSIEHMDELGLTVEKIADKYSVSEEHVKRFQNELKNSAKATKDAAKATKEAEEAAERHAKAIEKQRDALEKLGIVTENQVLKELDQLHQMIEAATSAGVPLDRVLRAITPRLDDLAKKAKESGVDMKQFGATLDQATGAARRALAAFMMPVAKSGLEGLKLPVVELSKAMSVGAIQAENLTNSFHFFGQKTRVELEATARAAVAHFKYIKASGTATAEQTEQAFEEMEKALEAAGMAGGLGFTRGLKQSLERIPDIVVGALTGGGGLKGAVQAIGSMLGAELGKAMGKSLGKQIAGLSVKWGGLLGGAVGSLLGPALGGLVGFFMKSESRQVNDLRDEFFSQFGVAGFGSNSAFHNLARQLHELGPAGDQLFQRVINAKKVEDFERAVRDVEAALGGVKAKTDAFNGALGGMLSKIQELGTGLPASLREYLSELERAGKLSQANIDLIAQLAGDGEVDWKKIQEAVQRYGGDIEKLGGSFQTARMHESWQQVIDDIDLFTRGNIAANDILDLTDDKIIALVQQSMKFGTEIPENMRPWIEKLIEAGLLVDDNGEKITDIGKLKFGETLQTSLQILTQTIKDLIAEFQKVPAAVRAIPRDVDTTVTVRRRYVDEDAGEPPPPREQPDTASTGGLVGQFGMIRPRPFTSGGVVPSINWRPIGLDRVPILAKPYELILTEAQQGNIGNTLHAAMAALAAVQTSRASHQAVAQPELPRDHVTVIQVPPGELTRAMTQGVPIVVRALRGNYGGNATDLFLHGQPVGGF